MIPVALTIAGTDSSGGAGVAADLKTFAAHGVHGAMAVTLVTAQSTERLEEVYRLPETLVRAQIDQVAGDMAIAAVKTGALGSPATVEVVASAVGTHRLPNLVLDPVAVASVGTPLGTPDLLQALSRSLLPRATLVTPNLAEAAALSGRPVETVEDMEAAARIIAETGVESVLVTGGHLSGDEVVDVLLVGEEISRHRHPRIPTRHTHGTGCTLASAVAARLALGDPVPEAVRRGLRFVQRALEATPGLGRGSGPLGLVDAEG